MASYAAVNVIDQTDTNQEQLEKNQISILQKLVKKKEVDNLVQFIRQHPKLANQKLLPKYETLILEIYKFSTVDREKILDVYYEIFQEDWKELLFFAPIKPNPHKLQQAINELKKSNDAKNFVHYARDGMPPLFFALKFGNKDNDDFWNCIHILIEHVNINKFNFDGRSILDVIVNLSQDSIKRNRMFVSDKLKEMAELCFKKGIHRIESGTKNYLLNNMEISLSFLKLIKLDKETKLFNSIIDNDFQRITKLKSPINIDDGEYTILQLALLKSNDNSQIIDYLLLKKANPHRITDKSPHTLLELAALKNYPKIFNSLLKNYIITESEFKYFITESGKAIKPKFVRELLGSKKLPTEYIFKNGNTPLFYSLFFSVKEGILTQLRCGGSLLKQNNTGVCALDIIEAEDLNKYFDQCIRLDNYKQTIEDASYKLFLKFDGLINKQNQNEMEIIYKISKKQRLQHLLKHPLIHFFLHLKWYALKIYFWILFGFQTIFYMLLCISIFHFNNIWYILTLLLIPLNIFMKIGILMLVLFYGKKDNKDPIQTQIIRVLQKIWQHFNLYWGLETLSCINMLFIWHCTFSRVFSILLMTLSLMLFLGYHPKFSKWSVMLQQVFRTFFIMLLFFLPIIIAFSISFQLLFSENGPDFFKNLSTSIFKTLLMVAGEFGIEQKQFNFHSYIIFTIFLFSMSIVLMNFLTGVAVSNVGQIEQDSEINAFQNIATLFYFFDNFTFLGKFEYFEKTFKRFGNPFFVDSETKQYSLDFRPFADTQFTIRNKKLAAPKEILDKFREFIRVQKKNIKEQEIQMYNEEHKQDIKIIQDDIKTVKEMLKELKK